MCIAHITLDLGLRNQGRDGVDHDDIDRAGTHHGLGDLQRLLPAVRLGDVQIVDIDADILRIDGIQRMLRIDETGDTAALLNLRDHVQGNGGLTTGLRSVDLYDPALRNAALSQRDIQADRSGGDRLHLHLRRGISQTHHGSLAVLLFKLTEGCF